jgi:hypothetical protein
MIGADQEVRPDASTLLATAYLAAFLAASRPSL